MTKRDVVESFLIENIKHITPFNPSHFSIIDKYKNNNFGLSSVGFSLYSNGHNIRGKSTRYKYGLVYEDGTAIFSLSYFRKESDEVDANGYLMFIAPTGIDVLKKIKNIIKLISKADLPVAGFYIRYLGLPLYRDFIKDGAYPIKEYPWHPEAGEEDETFSNSLVTIDNVIDLREGKIYINKIPGLSKNSSKKAKYAFFRFENFLTRNSAEYSLVDLDLSNVHFAYEIIQSHFDMLKTLGKNIGSSPEDHLNPIDPFMLENKSVKGFLGMLNNVPVSVFIGEGISADTFALYTPFTIRNIETLNNGFKNQIEDEDLVGVTAIPTYAYIILLARLKTMGYKTVDFGGSEIADLNRFKRQIGGSSKPSYWVYYPNYLSASQTKSNTALELL